MDKNMVANDLNSKLKAKLSKKEKSRLERENKDIFDKFVAEYEEKSKNYIDKIIPEKIIQLDLCYNEFLNIKMTKNDITDSLPDEVSMLEEIESPKSLDTKSNCKRKRPAEEEILRLKEELVEEIAAINQKRPKTVSMATRMQCAVPGNKAIEGMIEKLKTEYLFFVTMLGAIKLWIQLKIPRIEDGNNFGVTVQEEIVFELSNKEDQSFNLLEDFLKYFTERSRIVAKVLKYPMVEDYKSALAEHDHRTFIDLQIDCVNLRNSYLTILDLIKKNQEKIRTPRNSGAYQSMF